MLQKAGRIARVNGPLDNVIEIFTVFHEVQHEVTAKLI